MSDSQNIKNTTQFPPMTEIEKTFMFEWSEYSDSELNIVSLINILTKHLNRAEGFTYVDKIKNLNFTPINGSVYNNPFVQILTIMYIRNTLENDKEKMDVEKYEEEKKEINKNIIKFWNELVEYLNIA